MLTAINQDQRLIHLLKEKASKKETYFCPACHRQVRLKQGSIMQAHFAHITLKDCLFATENESPQHLELKAHLYRWLEGGADVAVEVHLAATEQIADVLVNQKLALEVQCSRLSIQRLQERTQAYHQHGYQVLWLLGKNLWLKTKLSSLQKQFLYFSQNMGFYLWELDLEKKELRLRYLIHEDWHGQVQCLTKTFPFGQGDLLEILRLPYSKQPLSFFQGRLDQQLLHYISQQLYYQTPKWMERQRQAYEQGENLQTKTLEDFYPQVQPPQSPIGFVQISEDLLPYYQQFSDYYRKQRNKQSQTLYPPAFYAQEFGRQLE